MNLNGTEEDRKAYKERIKAERRRSGHEDQQDVSEQVSDYTTNTFATRKRGHMSTAHHNEELSNGSEKEDEHASMMEENDPDTAESFFVFNPHDDPTNRKGNKIIRNKQGLRPRADTYAEGDNNGAEPFPGMDHPSKGGTSSGPKAAEGKSSLNQIVEQIDEHSPLDAAHQANFVIDDLFGKIFGIERVHILKKQDNLQDVLEKISIVPENKLLYIEKTTGQDSYAVQNVLTLGDLLTYLCPTQSEDHILPQYKPESNYFKEKF